MHLFARMAAVLVIAGVLPLAATGCASAASETTPAATESSVPDIVGSTLDDAWTSLTEAGFTVEALDVREGRSIWDRGNWVVLSQTVSGQTVMLEVEKADDPACWDGATTCEWAPVLVFDSTGDAQSELFTLDGGPARLSYSITAEAVAEGKRTADIYFQDVGLDTESSHIDTIVYVDNPGDGVEDLGQRNGTFYVATHIRELDVSGVTIHVVVEQMRPRGE